MGESKEDYMGLFDRLFGKKTWMTPDEAAALQERKAHYEELAKNGNDDAKNYAKNMIGKITNLLESPDRPTDRREKGQLLALVTEHQDAIGNTKPNIRPSKDDTTSPLPATEQPSSERNLDRTFMLGRGQFKGLQADIPSDGWNETDSSQSEENVYRLEMGGDSEEAIKLQRNLLNREINAQVIEKEGVFYVDVTDRNGFIIAFPDIKVETAPSSRIDTQVKKPAPQPETNIPKDGWIEKPRSKDRQTVLRFNLGLEGEDEAKKIATMIW